MYSGIAGRSASYDLNLSRREAFQLQETFGDELRRLCSGRGGELPNSLWREVGGAALARGKINTRHERSIVVPTDAKIWKPSPADVLARLRVAQRDATHRRQRRLSCWTDNVSFIDMLRARMVAFRMGATRMSGLVGNCTISAANSRRNCLLACLGGHGHNGRQPNICSDPPDSPHSGCLHPDQPAPATAERARCVTTGSFHLAQQVALAADAAVIAGTGTEQPTGITQTALIGTFTGTSLDVAALLNAQVDVANANALTKTCGYVTTSAVAGKLMARQRFAGPTGHPLWQGNLLDGQVLGFKAMSSEQVPADTMLFGDWSAVIIADWGALELAIAPFDDFAKGKTGLRAFLSMDCCLRNPGSMSVATSIT